ncbi:hypothetical protein GCM10012285_41910 [Streptomyces kronopolitis]|uniref:Uncharacterized protein n=1 Tax=Streptomyces kronopolitis TaxID=1612435 RepID=A0ABQ2JMH7_9ACTN|nr:hypothetical protein [Streptomyces kronopolitis]GGN51617.1 hypothetical protein GCM10012285_41910 [Streptomyces kronopolitis]
MTSMPPVASAGDGPRLPNALIVALATGYVAGYSAAFNGNDTKNLVIQLAVATTAWLFRNHHRQ